MNELLRDLAGAFRGVAVEVLAVLALTVVAVLAGLAALALA